MYPSSTIRVRTVACRALAASILREGVVGGGRLEQPGQQGGLGQVQVAGALAEVRARGRLHAVGQVAEVDLVQEPLQDVVFGERAVHPQGEDGLAQLAERVARGALRWVEVEVAGQLLGDGAGAGAQLAIAQVRERGAEDRSDVDAGVAIEGGVLGGDDRLLEVIGHLVERQVGVVALGGAGVVQDPALPVEDLRRFRQRRGGGGRR